MRFGVHDSLRLLLFVVGILACCCSKPPKEALVEEQILGAAAEASERQSRAEAVRRSAELAVKGAALPGVAGGRLLLEAAELRERWFRLEHQKADAHEALLLYAQASALEWDGSCKAKVQRALLAAEVEGSAEQAVLTLSAIEPGADTACREQQRSSLERLQAFQPKLRPKLDPQPLMLPTRGASALITSVDRYGAKDAARIVVNLSEPVGFEVGQLPASGPDGPRLFVDVLSATYRGEPTFEVGGVVRRVRVGQRQTATRIVLDLEAEVHRRVFYLPEPFRLVIDVSSRPPRAAFAASGAEVRRVVLDPGHGGQDPGAVGPSGLREKDVTLDIARRAAPLLAEELGIATLLTRDADVFVPLDERAARANAFNADIFISIHCNATEDGHGDGVMTFVLDASKDAYASRIAARENAASAQAAAELANAMSRLLDTDSLASSHRFATMLQTAARASLEPRYGAIVDHGVKRAGFYVLAGARMPAVLFEASFISNPRGEVHLNTADYRQKLADAIVNAVRAFKEGR